MAKAGFRSSGRDAGGPAFCAIALLAGCATATTRAPIAPVAPAAVVLQSGLPDVGLQNVQARFGSGGARLAILAGHVVQLRDGRSGELLAEHELGAVGQQIEWSPDGHLLAVATDGNRVLVWDLRRDALQELHASPRSDRIQPGGAAGPRLCFTLDERRIITATYHGFFLWDLDAGALVTDVMEDDSAWRAFSCGDGGRCAMTLASGAIALFDDRTGRSRRGGSRR